MGKKTMNSEEAQAVKELIEKIPPENLEKAVGGMGDHTKKVLRNLFEDLLIVGASIGATYGFLNYFSGKKCDADATNFSGGVPSEKPKNHSAQNKVYSYRTDNGIRKAYRRGELKTQADLYGAYKKVHPEYKGTKSEVCTILGL